MPKISVVMPVYNTKEEYFRGAIESILNQSFDDLELIIVDDCSELYIQKIVNSYSDVRIKYYKLDKNQGAANARNFAIFKACGKYLAFMDSDDISLPKRLERQYNFLETNQDIGCLGTQTKIIGDDYENINFPKPTKHFDIEKHLIFEGCVFCQSSVMLRKEILDANNILYKTKYVPAEDYALWLDLVGKTKFEVLNEILVHYRFYEGNISHRQKKLQEEKCAEAQLATLKIYCNLNKFNESVWIKFLKGFTLSKNEYKILNENLEQIITILRTKRYSEKNIHSLFSRKFKKLFYHTHSISGQYTLFTSPINKTLKISFFWRLFCFITRGLF